MQDQWRIFRGKEAQNDTGPAKPLALPDAPMWRQFEREKGYHIPYDWQKEEIDAINAALYLRRPLLVTGPPGCGKSTLLKAVAQSLQLDVFVWSINSRTTLKQGLYEYDAIGRLHDAQQLQPANGNAAQSIHNENMGDYIRLGPLGSALAESRPGAPKALLIDEFDKSDIDLPNDLLHALDLGSFEIPELKRHAAQQKRLDPKNNGKKHISYDIPTATTNHTEQILDGFVTCQEFPFVVITSNGEREFPQAFLRRTIQLHINAPDNVRLKRIVDCHFGHVTNQEQLAQEFETLLKTFTEKHNTQQIITSQLLDTLHLLMGKPAPDKESRQRLIELCLKALEPS